MSVGATVEKICVPEEQIGSIKIIGVGGFGVNAINHLVKHDFSTLSLVEFLAVDTDKDILQESIAETCWLKGPSLIIASGENIKPAKVDLEKFLTGSDIVFIVAGLGGLAGTGVMPEIVKLSKEIGAITIAVVTLPFKFEAKSRTESAMSTVEELQENADNILVIKNASMLLVPEKYSNLSDMLEAPRRHVMTLVEMILRSTGVKSELKCLLQALVDAEVLGSR